MGDGAIPFIDGHLDLAINALGSRRDVTAPLATVRAAEDDSDGPFGTVTVTLPELRRGGAVMVVSTLLARARPWRVKRSSAGGADNDYHNQDMAHAAASGQLAYYRRLEARGLIRLVRTRDDLPELSRTLRLAEPLPVLLTLEGADPILDINDLHRWHDAGVRTLMLAHVGRSAYAHGTPAVGASAHENDVDGPLPEAGRLLLREMQALDMPLDLSHLSDTSLRQAVELFSGKIYASHCACRALNDDWQRNITDEVIGEVAERGGVVGVPLHSPFLVKGYTPQTPRDACSLDEIIRHLQHICDVTGNDTTACIGSDMDGGFGLEYTPTGIDGSGDMPRLAERMATRGWSDASIRKIFARNWARFLNESLPS